MLLAACFLPAWAAAASADTIRQYQFKARSDRKGHELVLMEAPRPVAGTHDVLVRIHAASLNGGLDVVMLENTPDGDPGLSGGIPLSDGAGEVIAVGKGVTRFKVVDRVFDFEQARAAFDLMAKGDYFGKIVIRL